MAKTPPEMALFEAVISILRIQLQVKEGLWLLAQAEGQETVRQMSVTLERLDESLNAALASLQKFANG